MRAKKKIAKADKIMSANKGVKGKRAGAARTSAQRKMRAVKKQHPEKDIRFLFQRANATVQGAKKRKDGSKMTCKEWAERYGFKYAEGEEIPNQWIN